ncbi:MAG: SCO family protein [Campylobacterota bacterium]|nr:SCO family protein [Campylobacterota bacterium]
MKKRLHSTSLLILVVIVSVLIMIIPTFFTKGISRTSLNKEFNLPLILNDEKDVKLVLFGYSGCSDICTPRLYSLNELFETLDKNTSSQVGIEFLDISTPHDSSLPSRFAAFFNPDFKGIYLPQTQLRDYTKAFDIYFAQSFMDKTQYDHSANIYLVKKTKNKKELRYIYSAYPYDFKQIRLDIEELLNE